jgi:hypothetical protein
MFRNLFNYRRDALQRRPSDFVFRGPPTRVGTQVLIRRRDVLLVISRPEGKDLIVYDSRRMPAMMDVHRDEQVLRTYVAVAA